MTRAVIFDFGNVVCSFDLNRFLRRIARHSRRSLTELQRLVPSFADVGREYESGLISSNQFFENICRHADLSIARDDFIRAYCDIFTPIPATFDLVKKLKKSYKLGLMSNTNEWHYEYGIRLAEIFPLFDAVTLSFEVKALKPARPMYDDILAKLKVSPLECVFIDDIQENVDAAAEIGMHAFRYTAPGPLVKPLKSLGISF